MNPDSSTEITTRVKLPFDIDSVIANPDQDLKLTGDFDHEALTFHSYEGVNKKGIKYFELQLSTPDFEYFMDASWYAERNGIKNVISFDLQTEDQTLAKHSKNLYAGDFVDAFMTILQKRNNPVDNLAFMWTAQMPDSDTGEIIPASANYDQFQAALKTHSPEEAVLQTWTGRRIGSKYGLTHLEGFKISDKDSVSGILTRPQSPQT